MSPIAPLRDSSGAPVIGPLAPGQRASWDVLYAAYAAFYGVRQTTEMRDRVWGWIQDAAHDVKGFGAVSSEGELLGLVHFRPFPRPLAAAEGGFIDDLFVAPAARGSGVVEALVEAVLAEGRTRGWTVVRWITADTNYRARSAYDRFAKRTAWLTYEVVP